MHTLASPAVVVTPAPVVRTKIVKCDSCRTEFSIPADSCQIWPRCHSCKHAHAWIEAVKLVNDAKALREGSGVFADLLPEERAEQLAAMGLDQPTLFPENFVQAARMPEVMRKLSSDVLIDLAAHAAEQIAVRLGSSDVAPADRHVEPVNEPVRFIDDADFAPGATLRDEVENRLEDEARCEVLAAESQDGERWDGLA